MDFAIRKLLNGEKLTREDHMALDNSYSCFRTSETVAQIDPDKLNACGECLEVELKFRQKVYESIRSYLQSLGEVS